jgi:hypothetical protein
MKKIRTEDLFRLPRRSGGQTLQGFVRTHLKEFERALFEGVSYQTLAGAVRAAGFGERTVLSLRVSVCRARKRALECIPTQPAQTLVPVVPQTRQPVQESLRPPPKDERAAIARRLRELARPPRSGEDDPLD